MSEQDKPFVVNDRRKFRADGELRDTSREPGVQEDAQAASRSGESAEANARVIPFGEAHGRDQALGREESKSSQPIPINSAHLVTPVPEAEDDEADATDNSASTTDEALPPAPTAEEVAQVKAAYETTADRLDTVMRASNPGADHLPPMDFTRLVQSVYMSAMVQLGAGTPQGEQARVDLMGAKQSIEMLTIIDEKADSNLDETEKRLIESALFELRMGFLEITQLLARQAQTRPGAPGASPFGAAPVAGGPRIVT